MIPALSIVCLFTTLAPQGETTNAERAALEVVPMQHVCDVRPALTPPSWGTMLRFTQPENRPDFVGATSEEPQYPIENTVEMLHSLFVAETDGGTLRIDTLQDAIALSGQPDVVARARDRVREISDVLVRPLQIEVALWDATNGATPGVLDPRDVAQVTTNRTPLWRCTGESRSGRAIALDHQRWSRYVRDASVEVAQKQAIAQPNSDAYGQGGRVVVTPFALVGGDDFVLFVQFGVATRRGAVRTQSTGIPNAPELEVPTLETSYGVCSGRVHNGGALAITMRGHASTGGQMLLTIRVASRTPPVAQAPSRLSIHPIGALTASAATQVPHPPSPYPTLGDEIDGTPSIDDGAVVLDPQQLTDLVRQSLGADGDNTMLDVVGGHLFVRGEERVMPQVEALLRGLQDRLVRTATVRHVVQFVDATEGATADRTVSEIVFPTIVGRTAAVSRVLETNAIRDLFVEIAQEAAMHDPIVESIQSGDWVRTRVGATGPNLHLAMLAQSCHAPFPQSRIVMPNGGVLSAIDIASTRINHCGTVTNGQTIDHGDGPTVVLDGRTLRTNITTTVTW